MENKKCVLWLRRGNKLGVNEQWNSHLCRGNSIIKKYSHNVLVDDYSHAGFLGICLNSTSSINLTRLMTIKTKFDVQIYCGKPDSSNLTA